MSETELETAREQFLVSKGKGPDRESGHYRRNAGREIDRFIAWATDRGVDGFEELRDRSPRIFRQYARRLARRDVQASTVQTYWNYLSAWVGWCTREGYVPENYAQLTTAKEPLPSDETSTTRQQSWTDEQRIELLRHADRQAHEAIDQDGTAAVGPIRDRALAYVISYTGIRGAELLRDPDDDRREGAAWRDLSLADKRLDVLSKKQEHDGRPVPEQAHGPLQRLRTVLDPKPEWPLFPTLDKRRLRQSVPGDELAGIADAVAMLDAYRDAGITPPALSTSGGRAVMRRLTDGAGIDVDEGYLQPHGARRGLGRVLVLEDGVAAAAEQLDNTAEVVEQSYSEILAAEQADRTGEAFRNRE